MNTLNQASIYSLINSIFLSGIPPSSLSPPTSVIDNLSITDTELSLAVSWARLSVKRGAVKRGVEPTLPALVSWVRERLTSTPQPPIGRSSEPISLSQLIERPGIEIKRAPFPAIMDQIKKSFAPDNSGGWVTSETNNALSQKQNFTFFPLNSFQELQSFYTAPSAKQETSSHPNRVPYETQPPRQQSTRRSWLRSRNRVKQLFVKLKALLSHGARVSPSNNNR